ncbi:MAG: hypothetical protein KatS3mg109_0544 [Pirellulaceae bacterium]|nr:MAG: hypothetical protein KatS3mg109_0544 [Pirellulaceae bacterium]
MQAARKALLWVVTVWGVLVYGAPLPGEGFRVETDVFTANQQQPVAEFLTLFHAGVIYDYQLTEPKWVTIFDTTRQRFILLDPGNRTKTELSTADIESFHQQVRAVMAGRDEAFFSPQFRYEYDASQRVHLLSNERWSYRARGVVPKQPEAVAEYRAFADWYAQLSAMYPGSVPPYGRLELNRVLAEHGQVPEMVERTISIARVFPYKQDVVRTQHLYTWLLSEQDHRRIRKTGDDMASFSLLPADQFLRARSATANR